MAENLDAVVCFGVRMGAWEVLERGIAGNRGIREREREIQTGVKSIQARFFGREIGEVVL